MTKVQELKNLAEKAGITRWKDVGLLTGKDGDYYIDMVQNEEDERKELKAVNVVSTGSESEVDKLLPEYERALKEIQN